MIQHKGVSLNIISPGEALLLLIKDETNIERLNQLKYSYLCGVKSSEHAEAICNFIATQLNKRYQVSFEAQVIDKDPTRRFFETHLAYESLKYRLKDIALNDLQCHFDALKNLLNTEQLKQIEHVLNGEIKENDSNMYKEYADYLAKLKSKDIFSSFSNQKRAKIVLLVKSALLGVINAYYTKMPLNIYGLGIYSTKNKGKILLANQESTRNAHFGLMKGHMPLARNDIAHANSNKPYLKPSDQAGYDPEAAWVKWNFKQWMHPFSNSISGTMLCQLRCHAKLRNQQKNIFIKSSEQFALYNQLLIAAMLFNSGGHSLLEYTAVFKMPEVIKEFKKLKHFNYNTLENMFLNHNQIAFETALQDTIKYQDAILRRKRLHHDLLCFLESRLDIKKANLENEVSNPKQNPKKRKTTSSPLSEIMPENGKNKEQEKTTAEHAPKKQKTRDQNLETNSKNKRPGRI